MQYTVVAKLLSSFTSTRPHLNPGNVEIILPEVLENIMQCTCLVLQLQHTTYLRSRVDAGAGGGNKTVDEGGGRGRRGVLSIDIVVQ